MPHTNSSFKKGFSIIEILIGIAVMGGALAFYLKLQTEHNRNDTAAAQGQQLKETQELFRRYFYANRQEILLATGAASASDTNVQKHCVVMVPNHTATVAPGNNPGNPGSNGLLAWSGGSGIGTGLKTCAFDLSLLRARGVFVPGTLPISHIGANTGGGWRYAAIIKRVRMPGPNNILGDSDDVLGSDAEMLIVKLDEDRSLSGLSHDLWRAGGLRQHTLQKIKPLGSAGGYLPVGQGGACSSTRTSTTVCGSSWTLDMSQWIASTQLSTHRNAMPTN